MQTAKTGKKAFPTTDWGSVCGHPGRESRGEAGGAGNRYSEFGT